MKKLSIILLCLVAFGFAGQAMAKKAKAEMLHCGCNLAGDDMEYMLQNVSLKSKGHASHSEIDSCWDGDVTFTDVVRTGVDCNVNETGGLSYLSWCDDSGTVEGQDCGAVPPPAP